MKVSNDVKYSKELIIKLQGYFKKYYGVDVDDEKAVQYLDALADFYITLVSD